MVARTTAVISLLAMLLACSSNGGPALPPPTMEEGDREMLLGNYLRAAQLYERLANAASAGSRMQGMASYKACVCRLKLGQASQVLPKLQKFAASAADPRIRVMVQDTLSEAHRLLGQYPESLRALLAIAEMPRPVVDDVLKGDELLFKLGCAHWRASERDAAAACFKDLLLRFPASFHAIDAGLRLAVKGFAVRVGDAYPVSEEKAAPPAAGGYPCAFVKVDLKGRAPVLVAVVSGLPSYDEALKVAERLNRDGVRAEAIP